jgi:hypothetical protein
VEWKVRESSPNFDTKFLEWQNAPSEQEVSVWKQMYPAVAAGARMAQGGFERFIGEKVQQPMQKRAKQGE